MCLCLSRRFFFGLFAGGLLRRKCFHVALLCFRLARLSPKRLPGLCVEPLFVEALFFQLAACALGFRGFAPGRLVFLPALWRLCWRLALRAFVCGLVRFAFARPSCIAASSLDFGGLALHRLPVALAWRRLGLRLALRGFFGVRCLAPSRSCRLRPAVLRRSLGRCVFHGGNRNHALYRVRLVKWKGAGHRAGSVRDGACYGPGAGFEACAGGVLRKRAPRKNKRRVDVFRRGVRAPHDDVERSWRKQA